MAALPWVVIAYMKLNLWAPLEADFLSFFSIFFQHAATITFNWNQFLHSGATSILPAVWCSFPWQSWEGDKREHAEKPRQRYFFSHCFTLYNLHLNLLPHCQTLLCVCVCEHFLTDSIPLWTVILPLNKQAFSLPFQFNLNLNVVVRKQTHYLVNAKSPMTH